MDRPVKVEDIVEMWVEIKKIKERTSRLEAEMHIIKSNEKSLGGLE